MSAHQSSKTQEEIHIQIINQQNQRRGGKFIPDEMDITE